MGVLAVGSVAAASLSVIISSPALALSPGAAAQQATATEDERAATRVPTSEDVDTSATQTASSNDYDAEIVVTATRENTVLSRTPIAVTAVTGDTLLKTGITNATQLPDIAPNLSIDRNNGLQITIRGVSSVDNSEKGDPSAGFAVDGIFIARAQAQEVSFFDLERIEVLRGPQGTLFGRNTTAGVVSLVTVRPKLGDFSGQFDGTYGNFDTIQATGAINIPLGDAVALRAAVNYDRRNSILREGVSTFDLDPFKNNVSGRLSLLIEPNDRLTILVRGDYSSIRGKPGIAPLLSNFYQIPISVPGDGQLNNNPLYTNPSFDVGRTLRWGERQQSQRDNATWGIQGEIGYELTDDLTVNYLGAYRKFTRDEELTGFTGRARATGAVATSIQFFDGSYDQQSHELRLAYSSDVLKLQAGAFYFEESSNISFNLLGTRGYVPGQRGYVFGFPQDTNSDSLAFFGQGTFSFTDTFRATAGIRWTRDEKSRVGATINHATLTDPLDFTAGVQPGTTNPGNLADSLNNAEVDYRKVTWRAGLEYDASATTLLYGTVSTGYKAGGFNDGCLAGTPNCAGVAVVTPDILFYEPETVTSYEAGIKTRLMDNALRLAANVFHYDYSNLQLTQLALASGVPVQRTLNAGRAKVDGVELEGVARPADNHQFDFAATWLNARFTDYLIDAVPPLTAQFAGKKLDRSPEWTVMAGYTWTIPLGSGGNVQLNARTRLSDSYFVTQPSIRAQFRQPSFTKSDLAITYNAPDDRFYIQGFVRNIENELTIGSVQVSSNFGPGFDDGLVQLADPRLYGVRTGFRF